MGIGNTTAASAVTAAITGLARRGVTGRGTGVDDAAWRRKVDVDRARPRRQPPRSEPTASTCSPRSAASRSPAWPASSSAGAAQRIPVVARRLHRRRGGPGRGRAQARGARLPHRRPPLGGARAPPCAGGAGTHAVSRPRHAPGRGDGGGPGHRSRARGGSDLAEMATFKSAGVSDRSTVEAGDARQAGARARRRRRASGDGKTTVPGASWRLARVALAAAGTAAAALTVTDQTGRTVTLAAPPRRIVSLVPGVTEMLFAHRGRGAAGRRHRLLRLPGGGAPEARAWAACSRPASRRWWPSGRTSWWPRIPATATRRAQLERLRLPVYLVSPRAVADVFGPWSSSAQLTGQGARAADGGGRLERRVRAVVERVATRPRPRVLYVVWPEPLIVPGRGARSPS